MQFAYGFLVGVIVCLSGAVVLHWHEDVRVFLDALWWRSARGGVDSYVRGLLAYAVVTAFVVLGVHVVLVARRKARTHHSPRGLVYRLSNADVSTAPTTSVTPALPRVSGFRAGLQYPFEQTQYGLPA